MRMKNDFHIKKLSTYPRFETDARGELGYGLFWFRMICNYADPEAVIPLGKQHPPRSAKFVTSFTASFSNC